MNNSLDVIIIGGGIGGLATALSLHDIGLKPRIYEQAKKIQPLGVGINLLPHSVRELSELGLLDKLHSTGVETDELRFYTQYGLEIQREPRGKRAGYNWPQFSIHRGELQMLLHEAVIERLGHKCIKTNHTAIDLTQINNNINVSFIDSATKKNLGTEKADIVIAADGIHSTIRSKFYPNEGKPIYAGINLWRGTTWQKPFLSGQTMILAGTLKTGKMVIYPISQPNQEGKTLVNWVAEVRTASYKNNDWSRRGQIEDFAYRYSDWNFNWLDVPAMIRNAEQILEYPMVDRDPVDQWVFGRAALLGDSAHPMYSIGANGAGQAILDARTLAGFIKSFDDPIDALKAYEADRLPATAEVVYANRRDGPDYLLEIVAERAVEPVEDIHDIISQEEIEEIGAKYRKITGYDKDALNARRSLVP